MNNESREGIMCSDREVERKSPPPSDREDNQKSKRRVILEDVNLVYIFACLSMKFSN